MSKMGQTDRLYCSSSRASEVLPATPHLLQVNNRSSSCFCFDRDDDSPEIIRLKYTKKKLARSCFSNLTICLILIGYTFFGALLFLGIEGTLLTNNTKSTNGPTYASVAPRPTNFTPPAWLERLSEEARERTVDNIWDLTVNLNILYKENWTRLASQEITRFQDTLIRHVMEELSYQKATSVELRVKDKTEWTLATAFLYSLTVLTTIGFGRQCPRTGLGKAVTIGYAVIGIPLVLLYLSSVGNLLSNCARNIFTRSLCCCLCSNCGYCCYDEKRMQEKERRMRRKRERRELEEKLANVRGSEPFYVRSCSTYTTATSSTILQNSEKVSCRNAEVDTVSAESSLGESINGNGFAPLLFCVIVMVLYISGGGIFLTTLEPSATLFESCYFCFMLLSTIGLGDQALFTNISSSSSGLTRHTDLTIWFTSSYIIIGLALTSMCFNVVHEEIISRLSESPPSSRNRTDSLGSIKVLSSKTVQLSDLS
ncbi:hypothetical protein O3M35_004427 [Rhynocoris fuscipes]|uniref:Potassium channel domain-containing protein n=1 Tax=Rhynocoris fuscipes TaxID=488301 RepID=A0AAW1CHG4_9HEMI